MYYKLYNTCNYVSTYYTEKIYHLYKYEVLMIVYSIVNPNLFKIHFLNNK